MEKLRLVELVDENFEPRLHFFGMNNFYQNFKKKNRGKIEYYCFNPPEYFLTKISLNKKINSGDLLDSLVFEKFKEKTYFLYDNKYPGNVSNFGEFRKKEKKIENKLIEEREKFLKLENKDASKEIMSILKTLPFFSNFWLDFIKFKNYFLLADFEVKYFGDLNEEVEEYRSKFSIKDFKRAEYNQYIFEKKYDLFKKIPLF